MSRLSFLAIAVLLLAPSRGLAAADRPLLSALAALDQGREAEARDLLAQVLNGTPADDEWAEARFAAARAALALDDPKAALEHLNGLEGFLPEVADHVLTLRARAYRQQGQWSEALQVWQYLLRQYSASPLVADALLGSADAFLALDRLPEAREAYLNALRRLPQASAAAAARFNVARIDEVQGRLPDAAWAYNYLAYYRNADSVGDLARERLDLLVTTGKTPAPKHRALLLRMDRLLATRRLDQARALLADLEPLSVTAEQQEGTSFRKAELAYYARDFKSAIPTLRELIAAYPGPRQANYESWLARALSAAGETEAAITTYEELAQHYPSRREARDAQFKAAWLCFNSRQHERALKMFAEFLQRYPRDRHADEAVWYSAWNSYRLGDLPTALQTLSRLRRQYAGSELVQRATYWQGRLLAQLGDKNGAESAYETTIASEPLGYYSTLARQRLNELGNSRTLATKGGVLLASLSQRPTSGEAEMSDLPTESSEPSAEELPADGGYVSEQDTTLPWGASVVDWSGPEGRRALRLIRLGLRGAATDLVAASPDLPGLDTTTAAYARARLYAALGAFDRAYRLASVAFAGALKGEPHGKSRAYFRLAYPAAHEALVEQAAAEFNTSPWLVLAVMRQESAFRPEVRSPMNARGLMQILPGTGMRIADALEVEPFTSEMLNSPQVSVRFGAWYLAQLAAKFRGNPALTVSAYNAGPTIVSGWARSAQGAATDEFVEEIPFKETRGYVRHVLGNLAVYSALYGGTPVEIPDQLPQSFLPEPSF